MMKKLLLAMGALLLFNILWGQQPRYDKKYADSLIQVLNNPSDDNVAYTASVALIQYYHEKGLFYDAMQYIDRNIILAQQLNNKKFVAKSLHRKGQLFTNLTQYDSAKYYISAAQKTATEIRDTAVMANCYSTLAFLANYQSDYSTATAFLMKAADLLEKTTTPELQQLLPPVYINIGYNLVNENQLHKGIGYTKKALAYSGFAGENRYRTMACLTVCDAYLKLQHNDSARTYLDAAIAVNSHMDNIVIRSMVASTSGSYYTAIADQTKALQSYLLAYAICDSINNDFLKAETAGLVAQLYLQQKNYPLAEHYASAANTIALRLHQFKVAASTFTVLKQIAAANNDYKKALRFAELNKLYADSATNSETQRTTLSLESKYQNQKKEKEIADLSIANAQKEMAVIKRNRLLLIGGISAATLMVLLIFLYRYSKQKQKLAEKEKEMQLQQIAVLEKQQQVISMQSMIQGQETERSRIAKDLHDELGGVFSTVKMYLSTLEHQQPALQQDELFKKSFSMVDTAATEVRRVAHNMMSEVLQKMGLVNAVKDLCDTISASRVLQVSFEVNGMDKRLATNVEIMLYRIIQELLNNIVKHAGAGNAIVQLIRDDNRLSITVEDDGRGFDTAAMNAGTGLETVKSRVNYLAGSITIESSINVGTTVMMEFSLTA